MNSFDVGYSAFMFGLEKSAGLLDTLDDISATASRFTINSDKRNTDLDAKLDQLIALSRARTGRTGTDNDEYKLKFIGADPAAKRLIKKKRRVLEATIRDMLRDSAEEEDLDIL